MAPKRPVNTEKNDTEAPKPRKGFRVGPDNLPDGPWRRKGTPQLTFHQKFSLTISTPSHQNQERSHPQGQSQESLRQDQGAREADTGRR